MTGGSVNSSLTPSLSTAKRNIETDRQMGSKEYTVFAISFLELDDNVASVLSRAQILKCCGGVFKGENLLVNNRLEVDFVLCKEIA